MPFKSEFKPDPKPEPKKKKKKGWKKRVTGLESKPIMASSSKRDPLVYNAMCWLVWLRDLKKCSNKECSFGKKGEPVKIPNPAPHNFHHKVKRSQGGSDDPDNLALLCAGCHDIAEGKNPVGGEWRDSQAVEEDIFEG